METGKQKTRWYIDIDGNISGPFPAMDVVRRLVDGKMSVKHRVSLDRQSFKAVCNEGFFEGFITELIRDLSSSVNKMAPGAKSESQARSNEPGEASGLFNTDELKRSITQQLEQANKLSEINVGVASLRRLLADISDNKKVVAVITAKIKPIIHVEDENEIIHVPVKEPGPGWFENRFVRTMIIMLVLFSLGNMGYQFYSAKQERDRTARIEATRLQAMQAKINGDYETALNLFGEIRDEKYLDGQTLLAMAEAHLAKNNPKEGQSILERLLRMPSTDKSTQAKAFSMLGVIAMRNRDLKGAQTEFEKALSVGGDVYSSLHNLGVMYLNENHPEKAEPFLLKALSLGVKGSEPSLLALFEAALALEKIHPQAPQQPNSTVAAFERLNRVEKKLHELANSSVEYRERSLIALVRISLAKGELAAAEQMARQVLVVSPLFEVPETVAQDIDYGRTTWSHVYSWCVEVFTLQQTNPIYNALFAKCMLHTTNTQSPSKAIPYARFAQVSLPGDPHVKGIYAYALAMSGDGDGARRLLAGERTEQMSKLALLSLAKVCEQKNDKGCAADYRAKMQAQLTPPVASPTGAERMPSSR